MKAENVHSVAVPTSRYLLFASIATGGCVSDLLTKLAVFRWLGLPGESSHTWWLIEDYVGIQTAVNQGALFGMFQGFSALFALLSVAAAAGIITWLFYHRAAHDRLLTVSLACVMGGIFGNLYDRLGLWHAADAAEHLRYGVRDWILFEWPGIGTWPNFNIADMLLVCGAGLLMWHALTTAPQAPSEASA